MEQRRTLGTIAGTVALIGVVGALVLWLTGMLGTHAERGNAAQEVATGPTMDAVAVVERVAPAVVTVMNFERGTGGDVISPSE